MLSLLRTFCLTCCVAGFTCSAQARPVPYEVFGLRPSKGNSQRVVKLGDSKSRARQVLGPPTKISRFYYEIDRAWATVWHYGSNQLFFLADRLDIAELADNRWIIGKSGTPGFRVGSVPKMTKPSANAATLLAFGNFALENKPGIARNLPYAAISYDNFKLPQGGVSDDGYEILFDKQGKVSHVFFGSN
jgi:hypothetical protein